MFETFSIPALYIGAQPEFSLISSGKTSGVIVDSGNDITYVIPISEN